jgi:hypothetical protein
LQIKINIIWKARLVTRTLKYRSVLQFVPNAAISGCFVIKDSGIPIKVIMMWWNGFI